MHFENRHYVIFDVSEVSAIDFSEVKETSQETIRKSLDEAKSFIKYEGAMPASVTSLTTKTREYSHEEILSILSGQEWVEPNPGDEDLF